jgi:hypothetical protein
VPGIEFSVPGNSAPSAAEVDRLTVEPSQPSVLVAFGKEKE